MNSRPVLRIFLLFILLTMPCPAVFAAEPSSEAAPPQQGEAAVTSEGADSGQEKVIKCPYCGEPITIGRHGQEAQAVIKCPKCGKTFELGALCPEEICKPWSYGADLSFLSKYVSRGVVTTDGWVFEPNVWLSYKGLTGNVWANMDLTDRNHLRGQFNEVDLTLDYSGSVDRFIYSVGNIYYTYPNTAAKDTGEVYVGVGYDVLLKPRFVLYYDYWQVDGFYGVFSVCHSFGLPEIVKGANASLYLSAQVGWGSRNFNSFNFRTDHDAFTDMVYSAALPVTVFDNFTLKPVVFYSSVLDRTIRTRNTHNDNIIGGVTFSTAF